VQIPRLRGCYTDASLAAEKQKAPQRQLRGFLIWLRGIDLLAMRVNGKMPNLLFNTNA
jgi:hypothetical protein